MWFSNRRAKWRREAKVRDQRRMEPSGGGGPAGGPGGPAPAPGPGNGQQAGADCGAVVGPGVGPPTPGPVTPVGSVSPPRSLMNGGANGPFNCYSSITSMADSYR